jgi:hypothetical protein
MRKSLTIILCLFVSYSLIAQEPTVKQKEVGLVFSNFDSFGLTFKTGSEKSLWRFNTLLISGANMDNASDSVSDNQSNMGFSIEIGKEYRKHIIDNLEMRLGADLSFRYSQSKYDYEDKTVDGYDRLVERTTYHPGINLVFGFNYVIKDNIVLGAELLPSFNYTTGTSVEKTDWKNNSEEVKTDISGFNYGLRNTYARLSVSYRF